jgi:MoxR-like ATPase
MNANKILTIALDLQKAHTKLELVDMARAFGWRGDHARATMLQIALYVGTKLAEDDAPSPATEHRMPEQAQPERDQPEQAQPEQAQPEQAQPEQAQPEQAQPEQDQPEQDQPEQDQPEQDQPEQNAPDDAQWRAMLKAAGIDKPHSMLRKVYHVAVIGRMIPMLVGEAGTGKTFLAEQLGKLLRVPFSSISCTEGMSESQLTGWLLPVGESGRFDYVPSPFVQSIQQQSVFLLDEFDAADGNVALIMNSLLSNGFLTVPHKLENPTIRRHPDSIIIMGVNSPNGATELYTARGRLDASTLDRVYPMTVDYDASYEKSLFVIPGQKRRLRSSEWEPSTAIVDEQVMAQLQEWFFVLRKRKTENRVNRIVSSRMAQRLVAGALAGIPVDEVKADNLLFWTADEQRRAGVTQ